MFYIKHSKLVYIEIDKVLLDWYNGLITKNECFIKIKLITKLKN